MDLFMNVEKITISFLNANNFDGLYSDNCGCKIDDLFPCGNEGVNNCHAGVLVQCDDDGYDEHEFCIGKLNYHVVNGDTSSQIHSNIITLSEAIEIGKKHAEDKNIAIGIRTNSGRKVKYITPELHISGWK